MKNRVPDSGKELGLQIRELRKSKGLTLSALAKAIQKSNGYTSQIERGLSEVSIPTLTRIAYALDVQLSWFFNNDERLEDTAESYIVRQQNRRRLRYTGTGVSEEMLSPSIGGEGLMILTRTEAGASGGEPISRDVEESGLVVRGELELSIENDGKNVWHHLHTGDSFCIPRNLKHEFRNPGSQPSEVVWFLTPAKY